MKTRSFFLCILLFMVCFCGGCGIIDYYFLEPPQDTAQDLMEAGRLAMQENDYRNAVKYFKELKERYPFSPYTKQAELGLADAYFLRAYYSEAEEVYKEFEALHPGDENIPYVLYQIGLCNFKQFKSIDLPQDKVLEAQQYFTRVKQSYPETKYSDKAQEYIIECKRYLAKHELYVGDFYWSKGHYKAAWKRYHRVVQNYPELTDIYEYALSRDKAAYLKYQEMKSEQERISEHGSWKEWFDWL